MYGKKETEEFLFMIPIDACCCLGWSQKLLHLKLLLQISFPDGESMPQNKSLLLMQFHLHDIS